MSTQEFHERVDHVIGNAEYTGIHLHISPGSRPQQRRRQMPPSPSAKGIHAQWQRDHEEDQAFIRATRIAATRPERLLLQRLIHAGARHEHVRELWQMGMLKVRDDQLQLRQFKHLPYAAAVVFICVAGSATPLVELAFRLHGKSPIWVIPFLLFSCAALGAGWAGRSFMKPWRYARRYQAVVEQVNNSR